MKTRLSTVLPAIGLGLAVISSATLVSARPGGPHGGHAPHMQELDTNSDGEITTAEIEAAAATEAQATDTNGDGIISVEELIARHELKRKQRIAERLSAADADDNGQISLNEFANQRVQRTLRLDRDGDGVVSSDEARPPKRGMHPAEKD